MDLSDYRKQIDQIDDELIKLFSRRMETAAHIARYKKEDVYKRQLHSRGKERKPAPVHTRPRAYRVFTAPLPKITAQPSLTKASISMKA